MKRQAGFTLIELMVTVVIIGILTAIAVPNYSRYIQRTRLTDAFSALAGMQPIAEQYWSNNRTYVGLDATTGTPAVATYLPRNTENFVYSMGTGADVATASTYTIVATGRGQTTGFTFTIDQNGNRRTTALPTGWTVTATCWVIDKSGRCSQ